MRISKALATVMTGILGACTASQPTSMTGAETSGAADADASTPPSGSSQPSTDAGVSPDGASRTPMSDEQDASGADTGPGIDSGSGALDASVAADAGHASGDSGSAGADAGSTGNAHRLFMSDFGGTVAVTSPMLNGTNGWWPVVGSDDGDSWPLVLYNGMPFGLQPIANSDITYNSSTGNIDSPPGTPMFGAGIVTGTRHDGTTGPMLHQAQYQSFDGVMQLPYIVEPGSDVTSLYISTYIKFCPNLLSQMGPNEWFTFAEWKDSAYLGSSPNPGYRIAIYVMTDASGHGWWDMHGDDDPQGPFFWDQTSHSAVPVGTWFHFEWAWRRTTDASSFSWVKINGTTILSQSGGGTRPGFYNATSYPINRIMISNLYSDSQRSLQNPFEQWTDHIEIWDAVP